MAKRGQFRSKKANKYKNKKWKTWHVTKEKYRIIIRSDQNLALFKI